MDVRRGGVYAGHVLGLDSYIIDILKKVVKGLNSLRGQARKINKGG